MISNSQTENLKQLIGPRHIAQISKYLHKIRAFNKDDEPYSTIYISRVFNGLVSNKELEKHIWDFADIRVKETEEEEKRKQEILQRHNNLQENQDTNATI